jgi:hypothetical protein
MSPRAAANLRRSIQTLFQTIGALHQVGGVDQLFLQNLEQLHDNIVEIYDTANTPGGQLDVATIEAHLHRNLRQSAFTDSRGHFNVTMQGAPPNAPPNNPGHPVEPFTVDSGKSSKCFAGVAPFANPYHLVLLHNLVPLALPDNPPNPPLVQYTHDIYNPISNPDGNIVLSLLPNSPQKVQSFPIDFARSFDNYVSPGGLLHGRNPITIGRGVNILTDTEKESIIRELCRSQQSFSKNITINRLNPGEILVRCCEKGSNEPGSWWVKIGDMPLSIVDVRDGIAVKSEWNQDGNLEFFIVPEGCNTIILEGPASSQKLTATNTNKRLPLGKHARLQLIGSLLHVHLPQRCDDVDGHYHLRGGTNQIDIIGNYNIGRAGFAFLQYMQCVAIIQTGFDVELKL